MSNFGILASRSLGRRDIAKLARIIEFRPGVMKVDGIKTNYISSREFKLMALIQYNKYYLRKRLLQELSKDLTEMKLKEEERRKAEAHLCKVADVTVTYTTEVVHDMEEDLRKVFPEAKYIDLECVLSKDRKEMEK